MPDIKQSLHSLLQRLGHVFPARVKEELIHLEPPGYAKAKPGNKILVLEEERDLCLLIKQFLTRKNFEVQLAHDGTNGVAYAAATNPDTIWVSSQLIAQNPHLLLKLREAAPSARITEKAGKTTYLKSDQHNDGAKIE